MKSEADLKPRDILTFAVELGITMLQNGAEIFRIEESIERILQSYHIEHYDVYVLSNGIFASACEDDDDACSLVRHMPKNTVNLSRIAELNSLSRQACSKEITFEEGWNKLKEIRNQPSYPNWLIILACGIGCGCFGYLFGGDVYDSLFAALMGLLEEFLLIEMNRAKFSRSISQIFASMLITGLSYIPTALMGLPLHRDKMIIGAIMILVPGIMFTTAIRDIYNGDFLSGAIHLLDALLTAICIAAGVVIAIAMIHWFGGGVVL